MFEILGHLPDVFYKYIPKMFFFFSFQVDTQSKKHGGEIVADVLKVSNISFINSRTVSLKQLRVFPNSHFGSFYPKNLVLDLQMLVVGALSDAL